MNEKTQKALYFVLFFYFKCQKYNLKKLSSFVVNEVFKRRKNV